MIRRIENEKASKIVLGILAILIVVFSSILINAVSQYYLAIQNQGNLVPQYGLEANPSSLQWGTINLTYTYTKTVTLTNAGTIPASNLNMTVKHVHGLVNYSFTWDAEGKTIQPPQSLNVVFTLIVQSVDSTTFSFDIVISYGGE